MAATPYVPLPDEVFDAPLPRTAYADEPHPVDLDLRIEQLMDELDNWRESRELRLLQTVVLDLHAIEYPEDALLVQEAVAAGWLLREFDDHYGTSAGKHGPFADEWAASGASRAYVRQEYVEYREAKAAAAEQPAPAAVEVPGPRQEPWWMRVLDFFFVKVLGATRIE
ncbi:hypothetical protein ACIRPK_34035 [Kitasatospora sp. NPDC101801]|uniref:hypothetical protein n=1 Tax=Kitasatospora sp. NPDC101801 TaxID=3364103 RepID=UPI0037F599DC